MQPPLLLVLFDSLCSAVDFPGCLAMASPSTLTIGLIDEVQRLHVSTSFSFRTKVYASLLHRFAPSLSGSTPGGSCTRPSPSSTVFL